MKNTSLNSKFISFETFNDLYSKFLELCYPDVAVNSQKIAEREMKFEVDESKFGEWGARVRLVGDVGDIRINAKK
ncbi:hypothetical protein HZS_6808 [Henneguya salminicola]|nr:hypothetical protein HZS_6808 [Henneguya salminicola]